MTQKPGIHGLTLGAFLLKLGLRALRGALVISLLAGLSAPFAAAPAQAAAPSGMTTLLSPAEGDTVGGNPVFSWSPVAGAVKYRVQIAATSGFESPIYTVDTASVNATPVNALPTGALYWRVAPTDGSTGVGVYTVGSFTRVWADAPVLLAPADGATLTYPDDPLLFTWSPLTGAQKYNVQIDDDVNFINPLTSTTTNNTSYTLADPQTSDQTFYWRIQGVSGSVNSPWSEPRSYHVEWPSTPILLSPSPGQSITDVVLKWSPVAGAATYQLQVSSNEDFTNNMAFDVVTRSTSYSPPQTLDNASYYWRVRARDAKAVPNLGGWSALIEGSPAYFTRSWNLAPTLVSPPDETFDVSVPTFRWTAVPYASHYELQISTNSNFSGDEVWECYTNQTSYTPYAIKESVPLPTVPGVCEITQTKPDLNEVIYWRVRAIDGPANVLGLYSSTFSFMLRHTAMPTLLSPADDATVTVPTLSWSPVLGVSRYKVTVKNAATGTAISGSPFTTYATSLTPGISAGTLEAPKAYTWYVQTLDEQGRAGPFPLLQDQPTFTYAAPPAATSEIVNPLIPIDGAATPIMPQMAWEPVVGAVEYVVYYGVYGSPFVSELGTTSMTSFTSMTIPPTSDTYRWFVNAIDGNGQVIDENPQERTFVLEDIPVVTGYSPAKCADNACPTTPETPRLEWTPTPHTGGYQVVLANDPSFTNEVRTYQTSYPSLTPREALLDSAAGQAYYWLVIPCRIGNDGCGPDDVFETASAFRKRSTPVTPLSPAEGAEVSSVTFTWAEYTGTNSTLGFAQGAKRYRIQVSTVQDFATILDQQDVDQTTYTPHDKTYPEGPLYWRVTAIDNGNNALTYSAVRSLVKASPSLTAVHPVPGTTLAGTPYFQWTAQPHVKNYELEVYKNGDNLFSPVNKVSSYGGTTRLTALTPAVSMEAGDYAWRVRRTDADNRPGPWTSGGVFTVAATPPTLLTPAPATVFSKNDMLFTWTGVTGAAKYKFEAANNAGFASPIETATTVMTAWAPLVKYGDGTIYWRVKVLDADNHVVATSATSTIVKDATAPTVTSKTPTTAIPLSGAAFTVTFSEKVTGVSTSTFTVKTSVAGTPVPGTVSPSASAETTTATFTPSVALVPGETYTMSLSNGITDLNGNPLTAMSWTARTALVVDGLAGSVRTYWDRDISSSASGGAYLASRTTGAKVSYTFTGTSAAIYGRRAPDGGYGAVYLDGVKVATASFYSSTARWKQIVWSKTGLANTKHTVELRVLGTRPSGATSTWVYPDAFRYGSVTLQETSLTQSFRNVGLVGANAAAYLLETHTASGDTGTQPYLLLTFKGTGISWTGIRSTSGGIGQVFLDGVSKAKIDTYGTASSSGQTLWTVTGLPNATHTVKITVTGARRSTSKGYNVTFDAFRII